MADLLPSVLDRLAPDKRATGARHRAHSLVQFRASILRDLEDLLNSHRRAKAPPTDLTALARSIFDYGIPDLTDVSLSSQRQIDQFRAEIKSTILQFDPRFRRVDVQVENSDSADHSLRFRIDAVVYAQPVEEEVVLHSYMDPSTRRFRVTGREA